MAYLAREGYRCIALRDSRSALAHETKVLPKTLVLTFDDGYDNFYREAFPILHRFGFNASVFVVTQEIGGKSRWDRGSETSLMGWSEICELHRAGVEFGSHTLSHPRLSSVAHVAAMRELADSKAILEGKLGSAVTSLAYPYGDCNPAIEELARQAGYGLACSTIRGNLHSRQDLLRLKRVPIDELTTPRRFQHRLSPLYEYQCRYLRFSRRLRKLFSRHTERDKSFG
jgi:peptidoglycan/xylan/chitin deacetylase (PgdA/CDA1 family)